MRAGPQPFRTALLALIASTAVTAGLEPLTGIEPTPAELEVFVSTMRGALERTGPPRTGPPRGPVVHVIGATSVEDSVDWSPVCDDGGIVVLAGPQVAIAHTRIHMTRDRLLRTREQS